MDEHPASPQKPFERFYRSLRDFALPTPSFPGEAGWRWYVQLKAERVVSPIRAVVVAANTVLWIWGPHPPGSLPRFAGAALVAAWCYLAVDVWLVYRRPDLAAGNRYGSVLLDVVFIIGWVWVTGQGASPFVPLIVLGVVSAPFRLPLLGGYATTVLYTAAYVWFTGPPQMVQGGYIILLAGFLVTLWNRVVYQDEHLHLRDALTGAFSRGYALFRFRQISEEHGSQFAVGLVDLDRLKAVNDEYGHAAGDTVLVQTVRLMTWLMRPADLLARWGGDEFLILWADTGVGEAVAAAERIRVRLDQHSFSDRQIPARLHLTVSVGIAGGSEGSQPEELLKTADARLYLAKQQRNCVINGS